MFVKHCKVEVYLTELKLCEDSNMDNVITRRFSKADTIGKIETFCWQMNLFEMLTLDFYLSLKLNGTILTCVFSNWE